MKCITKRIIFTLLITFCLDDSFSQPIVLPLEKSLDFTVSKTGDERQYAPVPENIKILEQIHSISLKKVELSGQQTDSLRNMLIQSVRNVLDLKFTPDIMINTQVCFNANGMISYVFFKIKPFFFKNADQILQEKLPAELGGINLKLQNISNCVIPVSFYIRLKSERFERMILKRDSCITSVEELIHCSDSLKIKRINLSGLDLKIIPNQIYRFKNLEELDLQNNEISAVHLQMHRLPKLFKIDISSNQLNEKNIFIEKNKSLRILNLQKNAIGDVPLSVRHCKKLESLWLGGNVLALGSKSFHGLRHLQDLNLYNNALTELPSSLKKLRRLKIIDLYYNEFNEMPLVLAKLRKLQTLAIAHNKLKSVIPQIKKLHRLRTFYAHHNDLITLPPEIGKMKILKILDIGYNRLEALPTFFHRLKNLQELDISFNQLAVFPTEIKRNKNLKSVFFNGNPFIRKYPESAYIYQVNEMKLNNILVYY